MNYGKTKVRVYKDQFELGRKAAEHFASLVNEGLKEKEELAVILAAGESQMTFLDALTQRSDIPWNRLNCFNLDDFWDPHIPESVTCGFQTKTSLYDKVHPKSVHLVRYNAADPEAEADRFEMLLRQHSPFEIVCQGIGTSGHLALNEPGHTKFDDDRWVRIVSVAAQSKKQLMNDPNFKAYGRIPDKGITMTLPALMSGRHILTIVPLALKRPILTQVLETTPSNENLPATILQDYEGILFLDRNSCPEKFALKSKGAA
jgi:glucosamine-6-phosphate deaminase